MPGRKADLGELETLVMLAVLRLEEEASARRIREVVGTTGGRAISRGALYATLSRLVRKAYLDQAVRDPGEGGRVAQHFAVSDLGLTVLRTSQARLHRMRVGLERVLELPS